MQLITHSRDIGPERLLAWAKAAAGTSQADPFCSAPAWQLAFHEAFSPDRRLFLETGANGVLAFAEKRFSPENLFLTPIEAHWLFGCPLMGKGAVDMLAGAMGSLTATYAPYFPKIVISGVRPGGMLPRRLLRAFSGAFNIYLYSECVQCAASLRGGEDGFLSRRSANHRSKLKKAARRALARGVRFERVAPASPAEANATYARMLRVEAGSWKGINQCGMAEPLRQHLEGFLHRQPHAGGKNQVAVRTGRGQIRHGPPYRTAYGIQSPLGGKAIHHSNLGICETLRGRYGEGPRKSGRHPRGGTPFLPPPAFSGINPVRCL